MRFAILLALAATCSLGFAPAPRPKAKKPVAETVRRQLEGVWTVESCSVGGRVQGGPRHAWEKVRIARGAWSQLCRVNGRELSTTPYIIALDSKDATLVDMAYKGHKTPLLRGVLKIEGDRLTVTHATSGARPTSHTAELQSGQVRWVLRRVKP